MFLVVTGMCCCVPFFMFLISFKKAPDFIENIIPIQFHYILNPTMKNQMPKMQKPKSKRKLISRTQPLPQHKNQENKSLWTLLKKFNNAFAKKWSRKLNFLNILQILNQLFPEEPVVNSKGENFLYVLLFFQILKYKGFSPQYSQHVKKFKVEIGSVSVSQTVEKEFLERSWEAFEKSGIEEASRKLYFHDPVQNERLKRENYKSWKAIERRREKCQERFESMKLDLLYYLATSEEKSMSDGETEKQD